MEQQDHATEPQAGELEVWQQAEVEVHRTRYIRRLCFRTLGLQIAEAFIIERGVIHTVKELTLRPVQTIRAYLDTERDLIANPVKYFLIVVGITLFVATQNGFLKENEGLLMEGYQQGISMPENPSEEDLKKLEFGQAVSDAYKTYFMGYQNFWFSLTLVFTSLFSYLFFRKSRFNFVEHAAINTYIFVHTYWLFFLIVVFKLLHPVFLYSYMLAYMGFSFWVYKGLFQRSWVSIIWRSLLAFLLSSLIFAVLVTLGILYLAAKYFN
jgi:hypothetical protein